MVFSAVTFLYLLPLAGLPVVFHLALKLKKRTLVFPTLMFFYRADPRLNSRRRIQNWLLLLMRVLLIALMLLALSRPVIRMAGGSGGKLSLVVVIDNSGSMSEGAEGIDMTKLECALEGARRLLASLDKDAEAGVTLLVEDPAVTVPGSLTTDRAALLACLDLVGPTEATGEALHAVTEATRLLHEGTTGCGAVHVFTDLQQVEWDGTATSLEADGDRIHVYVHQVPTRARERANVAVTGVQSPEQRILLGQPCNVGLSLRNGSDLPAEVRVNRVESQGEKSTQNVTLQPHEITTVALSVTPVEQGYHWIRTWIEGDAFAPDNSAGIGLLCEGIGTVLFVGEPGRFGVLPMALSPFGAGQLTGLRTEFAGSEPLDLTAFERPPMLIATTWGTLRGDSEEAASLARFVEEGGNLLVVPSPSPGFHAPLAAMPAWLGARLENRQAYTAGVRLDVLNRDARYWRDISQVAGDVFAERIVAYAFCPLDLPASFTPLLGAAGEKVVLAARSEGKGTIFVSGTAFSPRWNTLPLSGLGVVMVQRMAVMGSSGGGPAVEVLTAGERPRAEASGGDAEILSLAGDALEWQGQGREAPVLPRTGVYLLTTGTERKCLSVRASEKEGEHRFAGSADLSVLGDVRHTVVPFAPDADYRQYLAAQARAAELYIPLLLLAILMAVGEGLVGAPRVYRAARERPDGSGLEIVNRRLTDRVDPDAQSALPRAPVAGGRGA